MNVLKYACGFRYYIRHLPRFLRETGRNLKCAWWRISRGWCSYDAWNFCEYFLEVVPNILEYLANNASGYPCSYESMEKWHDHLISIANLLRNAQDSARDLKNEYYPQYIAETEPLFVKQENGVYHISDKPPESVMKYLNRDAELYEEQNIMVEEALKLLAETPLKIIGD